MLEKNITSQYLKKHYIKQTVQWFTAIVISTIILNCVVAVYALTPGFLHRNGGPTRGVWMPNSYIIKGDEGRSVSRVDENGYINASNELADSGYVLFMGNSQSNGIQVDADKRYISLLNNKLQNVKEDDKVYAYNVSADGSDFCDLVSGFAAMTQEFPDSEAIVLQISSINGSLDKMQSCTEQRFFSEEQRGTYMAQHLSGGQKLRHMVKVGFPFLIYLKEVKKQETKVDFHNAFWYSAEEQAKVEEDSANTDILDEYVQALEDVLGFLRRNYAGQIIILELPSISFGGGVNWRAAMAQGRSCLTSYAERMASYMLICMILIAESMKIIKCCRMDFLTPSRDMVI